MMRRELPLFMVDDWLDNWGRWCIGDNPPTMNLSDVGDLYESPERNHHEAPVARLVRIAIFAEPAFVVERTVRDDAFPCDCRVALFATYIAYPAHELKRYQVKPERWEGKRAKAAGLKRAEYLDALQDAKTRLARALWPYAHLLRIAA